MTDLIAATTDAADRARLLDHAPRRQRARVSRRAAPQPHGARAARRACRWRDRAGLAAFVLRDLVQSDADARASCRSISASSSCPGTKITMEQPRIAGFTRDARAYEFTADAAAQDMTKPGHRRAARICAPRWRCRTTARSKMTAQSGIYDTKAEKLDARQRSSWSRRRNGYQGLLSEASDRHQEGQCRLRAAGRDQDAARHAQRQPDGDRRFRRCSSASTAASR